LSLTWLAKKKMQGGGRVSPTLHGETTAKLRRNYGETTAKLRRNYGETTAKLRRNYGETTAKLRRNYGETTAKLRRNYERNYGETPCETTSNYLFEGTSNAQKGTSNAQNVWKRNLFARSTMYRESDLNAAERG
jgi:hypothetical protein